MTAAVPDPRFRDQLAEFTASALSLHVGDELPAATEEVVNALMPVIAAEVARVQAAANQRAAEERARWITALGVLAGRHNMRWFAVELRDAVAALAQPAPEEKP